MDAGLAGWLKKLRSMDEAQWLTIGAEDLFHTLGGVPEDWYDHLQFCEDSYTRNLVGHGPLFELITIGWLGHQKTPKHNHAGQRSWMWVVHGGLRFQFYRRNGLILIPHGDPRELVPGQRLYIDDSLGWHSVENLTQKPAVSVHLYAGPVSECQIFCEETRSFQTQPLDTISVR